MINLDSILKSRDITLPTKVHISQSYSFPTSHVQIWELDQKEGRMPKNWCFRTVVLEKTLESPLDRKEIKPVNPKGYQLWIFTGRTDAEAEALILWPPDVANSLDKTWFWERLRVGGEGDDRGQDGWMASLTGWTGWISLQSKGLSRVFFNTTVQKHQFFSTQLSL